MRISFNALSLGLGLGALVVACSSSSSSPSPAADGGASNGATVTGLAIVPAAGGSLSAVAGDALPLKVVETMSDGTTQDLPSSATVAWTAPATVTALSFDSAAASPLPAAGAQPTGAFFVNPGRADRPSDLGAVLFVLDAGASGGSLAVAATVTGAGANTQATGTVAVTPTPAGDAANGAIVYGKTGAGCANCHGATGHGSLPDATDGGDEGNPAYTIDGKSYDYPAPGLNAEDGNCGSDPAWNPALFAFAARADIDNDGLTLRAPMPDWLSVPSNTTGKPLTTQELADVLAFMKTQSQ